MKAPAVIGPLPQEQPSKSRPGFWIIGAIIITGLLWVSSVALPVWDTRADDSGKWDVVRGILPLLLGWLGILAKCPAWLANPLLVLLCITLWKGRQAGFWLSLVALAFAASAYAFPGIYGDNGVAVIEARRIGFYLWLGSFMTMALAHAFLLPARVWTWIVARVALVALVVLCIARLEKICPVGIDPDKPNSSSGSPSSTGR